MRINSATASVQLYQIAVTSSSEEDADSGSDSLFTRPQMNYS